MILQNQQIGEVTPAPSESGHVNMKQPEEAYRLNCIGVPGSGKSHYRDQFLAPIRRVTLWNPMQDFNIGESPISVDEYRNRINEYRKGTLRVTVHPTRYDEYTMRAEYDALCAFVYEVGAQHFCTEEIGLTAKPNDVPGNLNRLYVAGRHRAVSLSAFGQRFHQFPLIVRGTSTEIVAFRQTDPDDVKDFEDRIYPSESPVPLNTLADWWFIDWTPEHGAVLCRPLAAGKKKKKIEFETNNGELVSFDAFYEIG